MTTTQQNVPALRFKDEQGKDYLDWEEKRLDEICSTFRSGSGITTSRIAENGDYPVYGGNGLRGYTDNFTHEGYFMLIGRQGALCGNINRSKGKAYISEHAIAVQTSSDNDTEWLAQKLDFYNLNRLSESSAQPGLSVNRLIKFKLLVPELKEQQKIAAFLSSVDTKIEQLNQKKVLWEQYKKGMMQKLFSQQIRFKDESGKDYPNWGNNSIGELFVVSAGGDIEKSHSRVTRDEIFCYPVYANSEKAQGLYSYSDQYRVAQNCITVSGRGTLGIAHARFEKFFPIVRLLVLIPKNDGDLIFFEHAINALRIFNESTGVPQLTAPQLKKYRLNYAVPEEQQKIASFLYTIDQKIERVAEQIKHAQTFKKGLLQQMFI